MKALWRALLCPITLCLTLAACSRPSTDEGRLARALELAGENRRSLQAVLDHYADDSLKLEAARWLIMNMPLHYYRTGNELKRYREYYAAASRHRGDPGAAADSLDVLRKRPRESDMELRYDILTVDSALLVDNIDHAMAMRESTPWGRNVAWHDFLEFVLPYRLGDEEPTSWRRAMAGRYAALIDSVASLPGADDPGVAGKALFDGWERMKRSEWTSALPEGPRIGPDITEWKVGACRENVDGMVYLLRAAGVACGSNSVWVRGDCNAGHYWGFILDRQRRPLIVDDRKVINVADFKLPVARVQCETFALNLDAARCFMGRPEAPEALRKPFVRDVTEWYMPPERRRRLVLPLDRIAGANNGDTVFLAVARRIEWVPVAYGTARGDSVDLGYTGEGNVAVAGVMERGRFVSRSLPFVTTLDAERGTPRFFECDGPMQPVTLYTKYTLKVGDFAHRMKGGVFEASDRPDFAVADTLHIVAETPHRLLTEVFVGGARPRRYVRYRGGPGSYCNVAEIALYEHAADTARMRGRCIGTRGAFGGDEAHEYDAAWDGDPYTSMDYALAEGGWTGLDLGRPRKVERIVYTPRNRVNFIREGCGYELFYRTADEWRSLGRVTATADSLAMEAPRGALLYLHCDDGGKDERIFEYDDENGMQIFW